MNFLKKPQNILILLIITIVFIMFGNNMLSIGNYTNNDFTMTNLKIIGDNIEFRNMQFIHENPTHENSPIYINGDYTQQAFCYENYGNSNVIETITEVDSKRYTGWYARSSTTFWWYADTYAKQILSVTCEDLTKYELIGNIEQTFSLTIENGYNHFEILYNESLNGGLITPYLIIDDSKYYFTNKEISISLIPAGSNLKLGFDFTGDGITTPQLNNNIVLSGSYITDSSTPQTDESLSVTSEIIDSFQITDEGFITNADTNLTTLLKSPLFQIFAFISVLVILRKRGIL